MNICTKLEDSDKKFNLTNKVRHKCVVYKKELYVIGGNGHVNWVNTDYSEILKFNFKENKWIKHEPDSKIFYGLCGHSIHLYNNKIYSLFGYGK